MNEQLQKLYEQSFVTDSYVNVGPDGAKLGIKFDPEKFAELIVRECGKVAWQHTPDTEELEYSHLIKDKILEHFGVEE